jgi:hypothetical protein
MDSMDWNCTDFDRCNLDEPSKEKVVNINEENNTKNGEKIYIQVVLSLNDEKNDHTRIWKLIKDQR